MHRGRLSADLRAGLKRHRQAVLQALAGDLPIDRLDQDWATALGRAQQGFAAHGALPDPATLQAAARFELRLAEPWRYAGLTKRQARAFLDCVYAGEFAIHWHAGRFTFRAKEERA